MPSDRKDDVFNTPPDKEVEIIEKDLSLQKRVGTGPLNEHVVRQCQLAIDNNDIDFVPLAKDILNQAGSLVDAARQDQGAQASLVGDITPLVMQLKAHASIFNYALIGSMANIMLNFLETIQGVDEDALTIISAHHTTLNAIVDNEMSGDGGTYGAQMEAELRGACERYFSKRKA